MSETKHSIWTRLYRGESSFQFVEHRKRWFAISGTIIVVGLISLAVRGLNFSIDFKGGTVWEVNSTASVAKARSVISKISPALGQATIEVLTDHQTGVKTLRISAEAAATSSSSEVTEVSDALATMANVNVNSVTLTSVGPTWGGDITRKAEEALVIFLVAIALYISFRFEGKMAIAALVALAHDLLVTAGVYSLSGFQVSPDTVIAFLTILGYSLYDTIVVFDKIEENTKGLAASQRITYTETVNLSMNQVLMRSINTSIVAIMPVASILVIGVFFLGATALQDFGLALFIGLLTGAYSSIFIASPLLAVMKEREPRYSQIRQRLATRASVSAVLTPAAAASGELMAAAGGPGSTGGGGGGGGGRNRSGTSGGGGRRSTTAGGKANAKAGASGKDVDGADGAESDAGYVGPVRSAADRAAARAAKSSGAATTGPGKAKQPAAPGAGPAKAAPTKSTPAKAVPAKAAPAAKSAPAKSGGAGGAAKATPAKAPAAPTAAETAADELLPDELLPDEAELDESFDDGDDTVESERTTSGSGGASPGARSNGASGAGTPPRPAAKPRPGASNRPGGGSGAPRPRKKGKRR